MGRSGKHSSFTQIYFQAVTNAEFIPLISSIEAGNDYYLVGKDFPQYIEAQEKVEEVFLRRLDRLTTFRCGEIENNGAPWEP